MGEYVNYVDKAVTSKKVYTVKSFFILVWRAAERGGREGHSGRRNRMCKGTVPFICGEQRRCKK